MLSQKQSQSIDGSVDSQPLSEASPGFRDQMQSLIRKNSLLARSVAQLSALLLGVSAEEAFAQPVISKQPEDQSVSIGGKAVIKVTASGVAPLTYNWKFNDQDIPNANKSALTLTNVTTAQSGGYSVAVSDSTGSILSRVAAFKVDPTFTKITTGPIVTDSGDFQSLGWGDFNNDGYADLLLPNTIGRNGLYINNKDGTFKTITDGPLVNTSGPNSSTAIADYDNDGYTDVFIAKFDQQNNALFRNKGDGTFAQVSTPTSGTIVRDAGDSSACSWADYDKDGYLDLVVANRGGKPFMYRNLGDGTFSKLTNSVSTDSLGAAFGTAWADFNGDGNIDLFVGNDGRNGVFVNNGNGTFTKDTVSALVKGPKGSDGANWGDFDNDGDFDLLVTNLGGGPNSFYKNDGKGNFTRITDGGGALDTDKGSSLSCALGDYDNDGWLDVIVANGLGSDKNEYLYHNEGGFFRKITEGSPVNDGGSSLGCGWSDYNNDGFLDLVVANGFGIQNNFFYKNNGNGNHWLKVKLEGTSSNRQGVGANVRVNAEIKGQDVWQLRQITTGDGFSGGGTLAHFGLSDAAKIKTVRVEWPSGIVQDITDIGPDQHLEISEPLRLETSEAGKVQFRSWKNQVFTIQASTDTQNWQNIATVTNDTTTATFVYQDPYVEFDTGISNRFYRVLNGKVPTQSP